MLEQRTALPTWGLQLPGDPGTSNISIFLLLHKRFPNPYWRIRMDHSDYTTGSTEQWRGKSSCRINSCTSKLLLGPLLCLPIRVKLSLWVTSVLKVQVLQLWQRSTSFTSPPPQCAFHLQEMKMTHLPLQRRLVGTSQWKANRKELKLKFWDGERKKKKIMQLKSYSIQIG